MKPLVALYAIPRHEENAIKKGLANVAMVTSDNNPLTAETTQSDCSVIVILPSTIVTDDVLDSLPKLRVIVSLSAGLDHIRFNKSRHPSIEVFNNPTFSIPSVSEYIVSCIFQAHYETYWANPTATHEEIASKKALVIGYGNVGRTVTQKLQALGLDIQVVTAAPIDDSVLDTGIKRCDSLLDGIAWADIISINTSLRPDTNAMIDAACFEQMKPSVVLINAARGNIVENAALIDALNAKKLRKVFLDDIADLGSKDAQAIIANSHVTYTRHTAWQTKPSVQRRASYTIKLIKSLIEEL